MIKQATVADTLRELIDEHIQLTQEDKVIIHGYDLTSFKEYKAIITLISYLLNKGVSIKYLVQIDPKSFIEHIKTNRQTQEFHDFIQLVKNNKNKLVIKHIETNEETSQYLKDTEETHFTLIQTKKDTHLWIEWEHNKDSTVATNCEYIKKAHKDKRFKKINNILEVYQKNSTLKYPLKNSQTKTNKALNKTLVH